MVYGGRLGEGARQMERERLHLGLQSPHPPVELALGGEGGEVLAKVGEGEPMEVPLASEARPLGEDGQRENLRVADERGAAHSRGVRGVGGLPPVFGEDVQ